MATTYKLIAALLTLSLASCGGPKTRIDQLSKKVLIYTINDGHVQTQTLDDVTPGEIRFSPGDRLKIGALEFSVGEQQISQEDNKVRLQVEAMRYIPYELADTWEEPQQGEWIKLRSGTSSAPSNGFVWELQEDYWALNVSLVREGSGSLQGGLFQPLSSMTVELWPEGKSSLQRRTERSGIAWLATILPIKKILIGVLVGFIIGYIGMRIWNKHKRG